MIYVMVGLPGSGKTTYTSILVRRGFLRVSGDDLRSSLHGGEYVYDKQIESTIVNSILLMAAGLAACGKDVVIDECLVSNTKEKRQALKSKLNNAMVTFINMRTPIEVCKKRREAESKGLDPETWDSIIDEHAKNLTFAEGGKDV